MGRYRLMRIRILIDSSWIIIIRMMFDLLLRHVFVGDSIILKKLVKKKYIEYISIINI
jgi:hypothetical protein